MNILINNKLQKPELVIFKQKKFKNKIIKIEGIIIFHKSMKI